MGQSLKAQRTPFFLGNSSFHQTGPCVVPGRPISISSQTQSSVAPDASRRTKATSARWIRGSVDHTYRYRVAPVTEHPNNTFRRVAMTRPLGFASLKKKHEEHILKSLLLRTKKQKSPEVHKTQLLILLKPSPKALKVLSRSGQVTAPPAHYSPRSPHARAPAPERRWAPRGRCGRRSKGCNTRPNARAFRGKAEEGWVGLGSWDASWKSLHVGFFDVFCFFKSFFGGEEVGSLQNL